MSFTHILCPVDFSECSRLAVDTTAKMLDVGGGTITLHHVIELPVVYAGEPQTLSFLEDLEERSATRLDEWAMRLADQTAARISTTVSIGKPGPQVLELLQQDPTIDLVVLGSHGRTGFGRLVLGSVAERVVRNARCSVMVVRSSRAGSATTQPRHGVRFA